MKKFLKILACFSLTLTLGACSKNPTYQLSDKVNLTLSDVLKVENEKQNTIYYYYLIDIENNSDADYDLSDFSYTIKEKGEKEAVQAIDQNKFMPSTIVPASEKAYIAGYIGFPNNDQKNIGIEFNSSKDFLAFKNAKIRTASSNDIATKQVGMAQKLFENDELTISYDYSQAEINYFEGNTVVSNFYITYENKTDQRIVIPYVTPLGTLNGCLSSDYASKGDFKTMTMDDIKKLDLKTDGLLAPTKNIAGESGGYALLYLDPEQSLSCNTMITFPNSFIYYQEDDKEPITIQLTCPAIGIDRTIKLTRE
ncbi:hypothetical protein [Floccifex sp.]|uniref:hypothetical protein n=1 Tax=Floccifex sp. TaxID=2815810 RepID=UPI002A74AD1D|nr:hypothetical protein [Floccifex sp.]MDD7281883.1 hypothetical protein [Erysipelotrichaceae bacterium]MDY2958606.1 hypothetical protein [Floccifex sp.]